MSQSSAPVSAENLLQKVCAFTETCSRTSPIVDLAGSARLYWPRILLLTVHKVKIREVGGGASKPCGRSNKRAINAVLVHWE